MLYRYFPLNLSSIYISTAWSWAFSSLIPPNLILLRFILYYRFDELRRVHLLKALLPRSGEAIQQICLESVQNAGASISATNTIRNDFRSSQLIQVPATVLQAVCFLPIFWLSLWCCLLFTCYIKTNNILMPCATSSSFSTFIERQGFPQTDQKTWW